MHYAYDVLVEPEHVSSNHLEVPIKLSAGIIKHVSILFQRGCAGLVHCALWNGSEQVLPTNLDATYCVDGYVIEVDCYLPTWVYGNEFWVLAWNRGTYYKHLLRIFVDVQGVDEPDIGEAATTLYKTVESLSTVLKGLY
jgi:hypothetical protein